MPFSATGKSARHSQRHSKSCRLIAHTEYSICRGTQPHVYFGNHESLRRDALRFSIPLPPITRLRFRPRSCQPTARDTMLLFLMNRTRSKLETAPFRVTDDGHWRGSRFRSKRTSVRLLRFNSLPPPILVASGTHEIPHRANDYGGGSASGIKGQRTKPSASSHRLIVVTTNDRSVAGGRRRIAGTQLARTLRLFSRCLSPYGVNVVLALKKQQGRSGLI